MYRNNRSTERIIGGYRFDVVAIGELLIDFIPSGENTTGMSLFACNPGGAPANVLAMNTKLGGRTAFIGAIPAMPTCTEIERCIQHVPFVQRSTNYVKLYRTHI